MCGQTATKERPMIRTNAATALKDEASRLAGQHLRVLLGDADRSRALVFELDDLRLDMSRQKIGAETLPLLLDLAEETGLAARI
ncbi:MAG: glucose-6-phosphate isomerase, partial [SAR116 cluster bacterium MED-G06]